MLNRKSIIECNEEEFKNHYAEIMEIAELIDDLPNYDCIGIIIYQDELNKYKGSKQISFLLHDFLDSTTHVDSINGIDLKIGDNNLLAIYSYGKEYCLNGICHFVESEIFILPFANEMEFIDIGCVILKNRLACKKIITN